ncbi:MAG: hypothetical protein ABI877_09610, partial [Gemmatimonadaceae bacterium]
AAPGLLLRAHAGWAWQEQAVRGRASASWDRWGSRFGVHAGRTLDMTNDFRPPLDSGSTLGAIFGVDDYDYVRRDVASVTWRREWGHRHMAFTGLELARVHDGVATVHMRQSPFGIGNDFRDNRGVTPGSYMRSIATVDLNPEVALGFVQPGVGAQLSLQRGDGALRYQRVEGRGIARWNGARITTVFRLDAGMLDGSRIPAQQLFEVGSAQNLMGYGYKEFAGNRAIVARGLAMHRLPLFRTPLRAGSRFILPSPSPALSFSVQSAWVGVHGKNADQAIADLVVPRSVTVGGDQCTEGVFRTDRVSRPTCGWRSSVGVGLRFFGGTVGVNLARPVDHRGKWRIQFSVGQIL